MLEVEGASLVGDQHEGEGAFPLEEVELQKVELPEVELQEVEPCEEGGEGASFLEEASYLYTAHTYNKYHQCVNIREAVLFYLEGAFQEGEGVAFLGEASYQE